MYGSPAIPIRATHNLPQSSQRYSTITLLTHNFYSRCLTLSQPICQTLMISSKAIMQLPSIVLLSSLAIAAAAPECCLMTVLKTGWSQGDFIKSASQSCKGFLGPSTATFVTYGGASTEWTGLCSPIQANRNKGTTTEGVAYRCYDHYDKNGGPGGSCK